MNLPPKLAALRDVLWTAYSASRVSEQLDGREAMHYKNGVSDAIEHLSKQVEFQNPDVNGSEFHNLVINQSVAHMKRDEPAWMYSIKDAVVGARWQFAQNAALRAKLEAYEKALENILSYEDKAGQFGMKNMGVEIEAARALKEWKGR